MKLTIERLMSLTASDSADLQKIWPHQTLTDWQKWLNEGGLLFVARFNEHLLAAVKIRCDGSHAELYDLMVREVTRRRGVGLYLLEDAQRQLPDIHRWSLNAQTLTATQQGELGNFMRACGFQPSETECGVVWQK